MADIIRSLSALDAYAKARSICIKEAGSTLVLTHCSCLSPCPWSNHRSGLFQQPDTHITKNRAYAKHLMLHSC